MRLINADVAKGAFQDRYVIYDDTLKIIDSVPTVDAVPVVRCDECKHRVMNEYSLYYGYCMKTRLYPKPDWFCKDGERREDAQKAD